MREANATLSDTEISIFGLHAYGRLDDDQWQNFAKQLGPNMQSCAPLFTPALSEQDEGEFTRMVREAKDNGIGADFFRTLQYDAVADLVAVFFVSGTLKERKDDGKEVSALDRMRNGPGGGNLSGGNNFGAGSGGNNFGMGGGGRTGGRRDGSALSDPSSDPLPEFPAFYVEMTIYTKKDWQRVARIELRTTEGTKAEAFARFVAKLEESFPRLHCAGWRPAQGDKRTRDQTPPSSS